MDTTWQKGQKHMKERRNEDLRIAEPIRRVAKSEKEQSVYHRAVPRSYTMLPNDPKHDDAEVVVVELNEIVVSNTISPLCFRLARESGHKTTTTKLMAGGSGST
uniref:Uncharacterized protein n=1 Tax=Solanum tuberosum TaxID=4113 RepID=M1DRK4_SOLTU